MLHHLLDDLKTSSAVAVRLSALAVACAIALFIATAFLCAAIFVVVLQQYGLMEACLAGAAVFLVLTLITALSYVLVKREARREAAKRAAAEKSALATALSDPAMLGIALQVARTIGVRRLIPLLAIAGVALGVSAHRRREGAHQAGE
jgi:hypothetical protein